MIGARRGSSSALDARLNAARCTGRRAARPGGEYPGAWPSSQRPLTPLRAPRARLPRLPRVRARAVAQHARGLPLRPAAVRRAPGEARPATPLDVQHADLAAFVAELAGRRRRAPAGGPRHAAAQGRLPALLLPPPAPRGDARPTTRPRTCARRARAASCRRSSRRDEVALPARAAARAPSRPRCATARCWRSCTPAGCAPRRRSASRSATSTSRRASSAPAARAPRSGSSRSARPPVARSTAYLKRGRPRLVGDRLEPRLFLNHRGAGLTRQGLYKIVQRHARSAGLASQDEPAHAAPHVRDAPAGRRLRPALAAGDARPRRHRDHPALHAPVGRPPARTSYFEAHPRAPTPPERLTQNRRP